MAPATATPPIDHAQPGTASLPGLRPLRRRRSPVPQLDLAGLRRMDDDQLAHAVSRHGAPAFNLLYERLHQPVFGYCCAILRDRSEAEDVLQEAMTRAYRNLATGSAGQVTVKPWLMTIARHACIDRIRQRDRVDVPAHLEEILETVPCAHTSAEERERLRSMLDDLSALSESQRSAIALREMAGFGHEEIASALDTTPARSKSLISEARRTLANRALGREMPCADLRAAVAASGNRALRGRQVSAHAESCPTCGEFVAGRRRDRALAAFMPLLPATHAQSILGGILGGNVVPAAGIGVGAGTGAGGLFATLGGAGAGKGLAVIAAVGAIGTGAVATDLPERAGSRLGVTDSPHTRGVGASGTDGREGSDARNATPGQEPGLLGGRALEEKVGSSSPTVLDPAGRTAEGVHSPDPAGRVAPSSTSQPAATAPEAGRIEQGADPGTTDGGTAPTGGSDSPAIGGGTPQPSLPAAPSPSAPDLPSPFVEPPLAGDPSPALPQAPSVRDQIKGTAGGLLSPSP